MSLNNLGLGFMFTATDLASRVMDDLEGNLKKLEEVSGQTINGMSRHLQTFGAGVALAAVGVGGLFGSFSLADKAGKFESAIAAVGAVSNATQAELRLLEDAAIQAGIATQFSPTQATLGLNELAQAGYSAEESIALLKPALDLAAGSLGQLSPQEAAGVAAQAMKAFGIETKYATAAVDQMLMASNMFAMRADDLPLALGIASRGAQALNQSLTETIIAVGLVKNTVPGTERASTAVAVAMERMVDPKVQAGLRGIGVAVTDTQGRFRPFLDVLGDMLPALSKMSDEARSAFLKKTFGSEALTGINTILNQVKNGIKTSTGEIVRGGAALQYLRGSFAGASGVAEDFSKKMLDTFEGQKTLLAGSMDTLAISLGKPFTQALRPAIEFTIAAVNKLIAFLGTLSPKTKVMLATVVLGGSAFAVLAGSVLMLVGLLPLFSAMVGIGTTMLMGWAAAAWAAVAPLLPLVAIAAVATVGVLALTNNWWGLTDAIRTGVGIIGEEVERLWGTIQRWFNGVVDGFDSLAVSITTGWAIIADGAAAIWADITSTFWAGIDAVAGAASSMVATLAGYWQAGVDALVTPYVLGFNRIREHVAKVVDWILQKIAPVQNFASNVGGFIGDMASKAGGLVDGLPAWLRPQSQTAQDATTAPAATGGFTTGAQAAAAIPPAQTAGAATEALAASVADAQQPQMSFDYEKLAAANASRPVLATVELDGAVLARAQQRSNRAASGRSSRPVPGVP